MLLLVRVYAKTANFGNLCQVMGVCGSFTTGNEFPKPSLTKACFESCNYMLDLCASLTKCVYLLAPAIGGVTGQLLEKNACLQSNICKFCIFSGKIIIFLVEKKNSSTYIF